MLIFFSDIFSPQVLLRIYGRTHGEQALETVLTDTVVFTLLSERKLGPKLHGIFPGGRIEQYIPVSRTKNFLSQRTQKKSSRELFCWSECTSSTDCNRIESIRFHLSNLSYRMIGRSKYQFSSIKLSYRRHNDCDFAIKKVRCHNIMSISDTHISHNKQSKQRDRI